MKNLWINQIHNIFDPTRLLAKMNKEIDTKVRRVISKTIAEIQEIKEKRRKGGSDSFFNVFCI